MKKSNLINKQTKDNLVIPTHKINILIVLTIFKETCKRQMELNRGSGGSKCYEAHTLRNNYQISIVRRYLLIRTHEIFYRILINSMWILIDTYS